MSALDDAVQLDAQLAVTRVVFDRLLATTKAARAYGIEHPNYLRMSSGVAEAIGAAGPPFAVRFIGAATFRDSTLMPLDADGFVRCTALAKALGNLGAHEVRFEQTPADTELGRLVEALAEGLAGTSDRLQSTVFTTIACREIASARFGREGERVAPEVFGRAQVVLAVAEAEGLLASPENPWPWPAGVALIRRLERAWSTCPAVPGWVLEDERVDWGHARRAVSVAWRTWEAARAIGASATNARAAAHAAFGLAAHGLTPRGGLPTVEAATRAHARMSAAPLSSASGAEPHRVRTATLVQGLTRTEGVLEDPLQLFGLVATVYVLEVGRVPKQGATALRWGQQLAWARPFAGSWVSAHWLDVLGSFEKG